jgi:hypothetical protein
MRVQRVLPLVLGVLLVTAPALEASKPVAVSPGDLARSVRIRDGCPTFSWGQVDGANSYELAVYRLAEEDEKARPILRERVVGSASSWTPSLADCLAAGGHYVWFVRAVTDGETEKAGGWSDGRYFATPAGPTAEDVRRALEVLAAWSQSTGDEPGALSAAVEEPEEPAPGATSAARPGGVGARSVTTATAAFRAEQPDPIGETYGAVGISSSPEGAGMAAVSTAGGVDLVLDGAEDGLADTLVTESGIDRPDAADQTFTLQNSAAGKLHLSVGGNIQGLAANLQELWIGGSTVIDNSGAWQGVGAMLPCTGCVTSSDLASGAVRSTELATGAVDTEHLRDNAVTSAKIATGAVTGTEILDTTITYRDLAADAVRTEHIDNGTITGADIHSDAIGTAHLVATAVTGAKIADGAVTSGKIANGAVTNDKLFHDVVTSDKIANGEVEAEDLAAAAVGSAALVDLSVTTTKLAVDAVTGAKIADDAVDTEHIAAGAVTDSEIANLTIQGLDIADNAISSQKINDLTILSADLGVGSVTSPKLASDAVTAAKISDGVITAAHVDTTGGIYASKSSVYVVDESVTLGPAASNVVSALCSDANDLPISYACNSGHIAYLDFDMIYIHYWDDPTQAAEVQCRFTNLSDTFSKTIKAYIACVSVPGP